MLRFLSLLAVILTLLAIAFGAYIRASAAGLGCPDWPGCFGRALTLEELDSPSHLEGRARGDAAQNRIDSRIHRYSAATVGVAVLLLSALVWTLPRHRLRITLWTMASLSLLILQAMLGLWALEHRLLPLAVTGHLLFGFALLLSLYRLHLATGPADHPAPAGAGPRWLARLALLLLLGQLALGGWTSTHSAGLACPDFPGCLGQTWPDADYRDGFTLRRESAPNSPEAPPPLPARAAIHWSHRVVGLAAYLAITALAIVISAGSRSGKLRNAAILLSVLVLTETALGVAAIALRLPVPLLVAHTVVAGLLLVNLTYVSVRLAGTS